MARRAAKTEKTINDLVKDWGTKKGFKGKQGGWIYGEKAFVAIAQGWSGLYLKMKSEMLNDLTKEFTVGFNTFDELLNAKGGYRPTLRADQDWRHGVFAELYDFHQQQRGDARRAFRG